MFCLQSLLAIGITVENAMNIGVDSKRTILRVYNFYLFLSYAHPFAVKVIGPYNDAERFAQQGFQRIKCQSFKLSLLITISASC